MSYNIIEHKMRNKKGDQICDFYQKFLRHICFIIYLRIQCEIKRKD